VEKKEKKKPIASKREEAAWEKTFGKEKGRGLFPGAKTMPVKDATEGGFKKGKSDSGGNQNHS